MNENQGGPNNLLDTTDCLEAVGVFKGWKNFLFVVIIICILLLQICFWLVDTDLISVPLDADIAIAGETQITILPIVAEPEQDIVQDVNEAMQEIASEPNLPAEPSQPAEPNEPLIPDEPAEPNQPAEANVPMEPDEPADSNLPPTPEQTSEPNVPVVPEVPAVPEQPVESMTEIVEPEPPQPSDVQVTNDFLFGITFDHLVWLIRFVNAVLILTATLYCLTMLFSLKVSMLGRLGGINHITRAFFLSLLALVLLLPWHKVFDCVAMGAIFTTDELVDWFSAKTTDDIFNIVIYYLRFCGFWLLILLLLILAQIRSSRWAGAILRRLEII